jgi:hypothetical protein
MDRTEVPGYLMMNDYSEMEVAEFRNAYTGEPERLGEISHVQPDLIQSEVFTFGVYGQRFIDAVQCDATGFMRAILSLSLESSTPSLIHCKTTTLSEKRDAFKVKAMSTDEPGVLLTKIETGVNTAGVASHEKLSLAFQLTATQINISLFTPTDSSDPHALLKLRTKLERTLTDVLAIFPSRQETIYKKGFIGRTEMWGCGWEKREKSQELSDRYFKKMQAYSKMRMGAAKVEEDRDRHYTKEYLQ